jgi:hypothetical protein
MKKLLLALCMLVMLPMIPNSNRATLPVTTAGACEIGELGNACADRAPSPHKTGKPSGPSRYSSPPVEIGPAGMVALALLNWIVRL